MGIRGWGGFFILQSLIPNPHPLFFGRGYKPEQRCYYRPPFRGARTQEMAEKKILIVDDEDDVRLFLEDFFNERELDVRTASSAEEALEKFEKDPADVVLLDIMMPGMDGLECLPKLKKIKEDATVIMITALKDEKRMAEARKHGAANYIIKPFSLTYLEEELMKFIEEQS